MSGRRHDVTKWLPLDPIFLVSSPVQLLEHTERNGSLAVYRLLILHEISDDSARPFDDLVQIPDGLDEQFNARSKTSLVSLPEELFGDSIQL